MVKLFRRSWLSLPQVVRDILRSEGAELRQRASAVEGKLHQARVRHGCLSL